MSKARKFDQQHNLKHHNSDSPRTEKLFRLRGSCGVECQGPVLTAFACNEEKLFIETSTRHASSAQAVKLASLGLPSKYWVSWRKWETFSFFLRFFCLEKIVKSLFFFFKMKKSLPMIGFSKGMRPKGFWLSVTPILSKLTENYNKLFYNFILQNNKQEKTNILKPRCKNFDTKSLCRREKQTWMQPVQLLNLIFFSFESQFNFSNIFLTCKWGRNRHVCIQSVRRVPGNEVMSPWPCVGG